MTNNHQVIKHIQQIKPPQIPKNKIIKLLLLLSPELTSGLTISNAGLVVGPIVGATVGTILMLLFIDDVDSIILGMLLGMLLGAVINIPDGT